MPADLSGPRRVPFDETYLDLSYGWLTDPDMASRTMTAPVTREAQRAWWESLPGRADYAVWGIAYDGVPIGVMGIKRIGADDGAEYFMYLGARAYWGHGVASWAFAEIVAEVRARGLKRLYGQIGKHNERSLGVHLREGFEVVGETEDRWLLAYTV
jgi:RimJ/RimL family protein N-acetyltransferase